MKHNKPYNSGQSTFWEFDYSSSCGRMFCYSSFDRPWSESWTRKDFTSACWDMGWKLSHIRECDTYISLGFSDDT